MVAPYFSVPPWYGKREAEPPLVAPIESMTLQPFQASKKPWSRTIFVAILTFMLMMMGSAQIRATVLYELSEKGVQRVFETEVHGCHANALHTAEIRQGRKPFEQHELAPARLWPLADAILGERRNPASARAPPYGPRAPPFLS